MDTRKELYKSIVLSGATTMFPGYVSRLDKEIREIYIKEVLKSSSSKIKIDINIIDSPRRKYSVFIGGTVLSNIYNQGENNQYWITKKEWEESGTKIILKKCANILK